MMDLIERVRQYPSNVRRIIAGGTSAVITLAIAGMWMMGLSSSGVLAINTSVKAEQPQQRESSNNVAAIVESFTKQFNGESSITIVEATSSSTIEEEIVPLEATVIPF